jgi:hypothetical protein
MVEVQPSVGAAWDASTMDAVKTYRYLRIAMIGMVVLLGAAVLHEWWATGWRCFQPSISSYYYTPSKSAMVGSLVAVGVCLVVVKGNTEWEDTLLNIGGAVAPVIAFVPTPFAGVCRSVPLQVSDTPANVANNMFALLVLGLGALVVTVAVAFRSRRTGKPLRTSDLVGMAAAAALWVVALGTFVWARSTFLEHAHYTAAVLLFLCMVAVVTINAWSVGRGRAQGAVPTASDYANPYAAVAVFMVGSVLLMLGFWFMGWQHAVLWIEGVLVLSFAAFWAIQTRELWYVGVRRGPEPQARQTS